MNQTVKDLLDGNSDWVNNTSKEDPEFFPNLAKGQSPEFLWIGCSDSRVPANQVTGLQAGSIFVARNVANVVVHTDSNLLSAAYYAVKVLKVKHVIVCGHYGCGGVQAAMSNQAYGFIDNWIMHIKDVYRLHNEELDAIPDENARFNRFVELNVKEQVQNLARVSFIQEEWANGEYPYIHGMVYDLGTGLIKDLGYTMNSSDELDHVYRYG